MPEARSRSRRAATCAAPPCPRTTATCSSWTSAASSASASCWALRSGDAEYVPTGSRVVWLEDFALPDDLWARFGIPIGLAFFLRSARRRRWRSTRAPRAPPSASSTSTAWEASWRSTRCSRRSSPRREALIVNRMADPPQCAIAPTDQAYRLVGPDQGAAGTGISGGAGVERAVDGFFEELAATRVSPGAGSPRARVLGARRRGGALRGADSYAVVPHAACASRSEPRGVHDRARPRRSRSRPSRAHARRRHARAAARRVRGARALGRHRARRALGAARAARAELHRLDPVRAAGGVLARTSSWPTTKLPRRGAGRRGPAVVPLQRLRLLRGGRRPDPAVTRAVALRPSSGCRWRRGARTSGATGGLVRGAAGRRSHDLRRYAGERGLHTVDAAIVDLLAGARRRRDERAARGARRVAALRGLRPLPVHARGDQERHAHAVRDRLPAGVRRPATRAPLAACGSSACWRAEGEVCGRGAVPPAGRASATRPSGAGSSSPGRASPSSHHPPLRRPGGMRLEERDDGRSADHGVRAQRRPASADPSAGRAEALLLSLLSTHVVLRADGGRFLSPLESGRARTSTPSRCSPPPRTTRCWAPRSCCPTIRSSRPKPRETSSTPPRSRRRCCSTCTR